MELHDIVGKVCEILVCEFPMLGRLELTPETSLLSSGLLDSFAVVTLIAALEDTYEFDLDVETIELDQFETPHSIAELCRNALL